MKICIFKETAAGEARVAATPDSVKRLVSDGHTVTVQAGAGQAAGFTDQAYEEVGAALAKTPATATKGCDIAFCVSRPSDAQLKTLAKDTALIGLIDPFTKDAFFDKVGTHGLTTLAMEWTPRITRAQSMDALSSQSNLAGYRAVIEGAQLYGRAMPMMMTAAGTVAPAKVFIMGAGVAGLQAIATARRLGAVVTATDVRPAAEEQVASLGAKFIAVKDEEFEQAQTAGGYAKEMSDAYKAKQAELTASHIAKQDIVVTTALIPGRPAPTLVTQDMVETMKPGSVIVDMAVARGGNCPLSEPGKVVDHQGVKIAGYDNLPGRLPADASSLYAKNLLAFLPLITSEDGAMNLDTDDEIVTAMLLTRGGEIVNERLNS